MPPSVDDSSPSRPSPSRSFPPRVADAGLPRPAALPLSLTSFVGRQQEVAAVRDLLGRDGVRLVTMIGPGGVGKTRLAIRVAEEIVARFPDGIWFVPLASVRAPDMVAAAVGQGLGVRQVGNHTFEEGIAAFLRERTVLLVLDNFEHVLDSATLVTDLLSTCQSLQVMVTSRAPLRVSGEHEFAVSPLSLPVPDRIVPVDDLLRSDAVGLFVERAVASRYAFALTDANAAAIVSVCRRLDGLPLAIELAAARMRGLTPSALLARLHARLPVLADGPRDGPARHQTMRDAIAWSYALLSPTEQTLFGRLAVFVGGFTVDAAEVVVGEPDNDGSEVLTGILSLVEKSLLQANDGWDGEPRYLMLETIREFALERLQEDPEREIVRDAQVTYVLNLAETAMAQYEGPENRAWLERLESEHDNLRTALARVLDQGKAEAALRLTGALWRFWLVHGHLTEGRAWLERALGWRDDLPAAVVTEALAGGGCLAWSQGDADRATALAEELLVHSRAEGDAYGTFYGLLVLGLVMLERDLVRAATHFTEALALTSRLLNPQGYAAIALMSLGDVERRQGDLTSAVARFEEAVALARATGNSWVAAEALVGLGIARYERNQDAEALACFRESLGLKWDLRDPIGAGVSLVGLARVATRTGHAAHAARFLAATAALAERLSLTRTRLEEAAFSGAIATTRATLGEADFSVAWAAGRASPFDVIVTEAASFGREQPDNANHVAPTPEAGVKLSRREQEVLRQIVAGRTDREIATALFISRRTVTSHVGSILTKLGVDSRTAAAAWAVRQHLD